MSEIDNLPPNWVKKLSTKHKEVYYYFNVTTGETRWDPPNRKRSIDYNASHQHKSKVQTENKKLTKLSSKSQIIHKTPAQNRLLKIQQELLLDQLRTKKNSRQKCINDNKLLKIPIKKDPNKKMATKTSVKNDRNKPTTSEKSKDVKPRNMPIKANICSSSTGDNTQNMSWHQNLYNFISATSITNRKILSELTSEPDIVAKEQTSKLGLNEEIKISAKPKAGFRQQTKKSETKFDPSIQSKIPINEKTTKETEGFTNKIFKNIVSLTKSVVYSFAGYNKKQCELPSSETPNQLIFSVSDNVVSKQTNASSKFPIITKTSTNDTKSSIYADLNSNSMLSEQSVTTYHQPKKARLDSTNTAINRLQKIRDQLELNQKQHKSEKEVANFSTASTDSVFDVDVDMEDTQTTMLFNSLANASAEETSPMDWEEIKEEKIMKEITTVRNAASLPVVPAITASTKNPFKNTEKFKINPGQSVRIVIDTNIFLSFLKFIQDLMERSAELPGNPMLIVPYIVLQELDKIKMRTDKAVALLASRAIKFLNIKFKEKDKSIKGQSSIDDIRKLIKINSPDDSILNCCLQQKNQTDSVILLSNDVNLRNKAMCSDIDAFSKSDLASELGYDA